MRTTTHRPPQHDFKIVRPTQFDPHNLWDSSATGGSYAFLRYRMAIEQFSASPAPRVPRLDLTLAILLDAVAITAGFAPWVQYQTRFNTIATRSAVGSNAAFMVVAGIVAVIALLLVGLMDDPGVPATVGFVAGLVAFAVAGFCWLFAGNLGPEDASIWQTPSAGWGVVTATFASLLASIFAWRVMRIARIY